MLNISDNQPTLHVNGESETKPRVEQSPSLSLESIFPVFDGMKFPPFPPMTKDSERRLNEIKNFKTRPDDIILAAYPRSGTHWLWEILFMLQNGKAEYTPEVKETAFLESIENFDFLNGKPSPRVINTHVPFRWLPEEQTQNGGKIIHVNRNPKDVMVSMFFFLNKMNLGLKEMPWSEFYQFQMKDSQPLYGGWFAYEKEFESVADENGAIINLCYEELKRNPTVEIKRLADYLGLQVTEELVQEVANKCSFKNLKTADASFKDTTLTKKTDHYRKGQPGDWKNYFTVAQNEQFDEVFKQEMKNSNLKVQFE